VEQELLTLPDNMSSSPVLVGFMLFDLCFLCNVLEIIVFPFVLFFLPIIVTKYGTYMWLFLTQMFRNGRKNPEHGGDRKTFEVMTSTYPTGTFSSVASLKSSEWEN
jgi:hypothetical protein